MAKKKKSKKETPTHLLVVVPNKEGTYKDENGQRVNVHKYPIEKNVHTNWPTFKGTTIKAFISNNNYTKA